MDGIVIGKVVVVERATIDLDVLQTACDRLDVGFAVLDAASGLALYRNAAFSRSFPVPAVDWRERLDLSVSPSSSDGSARCRTDATGVDVLVRWQRLDEERLLVSLHPAGEGAGTGALDPLTGLPGRFRLRRRLNELGREPEEGVETALLVVNVDRFQSVNESLGHGVGDRLLVRVADRLRRILRDSELIARLDGASFAIVERSTKHPEAAKALAARIVEVISRPYLVDEHVVSVGAWVGIAMTSTDGPDDERLLKSAELALLGARAGGRSRVRFFDQEMDRRAQLRRSIETDLRRALALRELETVYQPLVAVSDRRTVGVEALLRWRHPTRGMVPPASFIPVAEETGLIGPIGEWVLRTACRDAASWDDGIAVAVNLSPVQMRHGGIVDIVRRALGDSGLSPSRLELEITEGVLLDRSDATLGTLHELRSLGVRIAMDDFGTGYSSLGYLRAFPFDKVKIDQSFIRHMNEDREAAAVVKAIVGIGESLGITITAEGVETEEQFRRLAVEGCDEAQGYLISRPLPARDIPGFIAGSSNLEVPA